MEASRDDSSLTQEEGAARLVAGVSGSGGRPHRVMRGAIPVAGAYEGSVDDGGEGSTGTGGGGGKLAAGTDDVSHDSGAPPRAACQPRAVAG